MTGIYCIQNTIKGAVYIGKSIDIEKRWRTHKNALDRGTHTNKHLQAAWKKYGGEAFSFHVLAACDVDSLDEMEIRFIDQYNADKAGYNMTKGGEGTRGYRHSDEYKEHMRELFTGRQFSPETREKMSAAKRGKPPVPSSKREQGYKIVSQKLKGRTFTDQHRKNISESKKGSVPWNKGKPGLSGEDHPMYGKHLSEETKRMIGEANRGRKKSEEAKQKISTPVVCLDTGEIFPSVTKAAETYLVTTCAISRVLRGKSKTCKGLRWDYVEGG